SFLHAAFGRPVLQNHGRTMTKRTLGSAGGIILLFLSENRLRDMQCCFHPAVRALNASSRVLRFEFQRATAMVATPPRPVVAAVAHWLRGSQVRLYVSRAKTLRPGILLEQDIIELSVNTGSELLLYEIKSDLEAHVAIRIVRAEEMAEKQLETF